MIKRSFENKSEKRIDFFENPEAEKIAEKLYSDNLPYHNFIHAKETVINGRIIIGNCLNEGMLINEKVVYYGNLLHDVGYYEDHKEKGFDSKEEYSVYLARKILQDLGEDEEIISETQRVILATHRDKSFVTNEEKVVRASDLAGMAKDYEIFLRNTVRLKQEIEIISGQAVSWSEWKKSVKKTIEFYLLQDIRLTSTHNNESGKSVFHKKAKENLDAFLKEDEENLYKQID